MKTLSLNQMQRNPQDAVDDDYEKMRELKDARIRLLLERLEEERRRRIAERVSHVGYRSYTELIIHHPNPQDSAVGFPDDFVLNYEDFYDTVIDIESRDQAIQEEYAEIREMESIEMFLAFARAHPECVDESLLPRLVTFDNALDLVDKFGIY
jgi:hypothetical protein